MSNPSSSSKWVLIRPFFLILFLHSTAIYLFTRGFLLTRTELSSFSHCQDISQSPCYQPEPESEPDGKCWTRPAVDRVVIVILDALRFDFVAPSTFFGEKKPWMDKLRVLQRLASGYGSSSARIFKAIADPPTTSLQRLKGLTTGGLPTFIDVGNSFGAPAIIEDNLLYQLAKNGKRVLMMGDDTWLQLFPDHFDKSYPYPSFNVKDLDTVDNGCIQHLLPSLYKEDWDVLVAHFLGVDHAGHIFGVDSTPMIQKLEQYNDILEKVVGILKNQSGPGGLHENTLLVVMGDHGQTLNGDHGGGTAEEVETSLFAMSLRSPPASVSSVLDRNFCEVDLDGEEMCIGTIQQLDFAATIAALLGIPFPFGSIGRVNPELFALSAGTWDAQRISAKSCKSQSDLEAWMQNYANALCINVWQVKRYIDLYSETSVIGLPTEDLLHVAELYSQAQANWSNIEQTTCSVKNGSPSSNKDGQVSILQSQIEAYSKFLGRVAELARSAWTEFDLTLMGFGLIVMLASLFIHLFAIRHLNALHRSNYPSPSNCGAPLKLIYAYLPVGIRGASFLSNSYILTEGGVACFLLATMCILNLWCSISNGEFAIEGVGFLILNIILRSGIEFGMSKQTAGSAPSDTDSLSIISIFKGHPIWVGSSDIFPLIGLFIMAFLLYRCTSGIAYMRYLKLFCIAGTILSYVLIGVHWVSESSIMVFSQGIQDVGRNFAPRLVYAIGFGLLLMLILSRIVFWKENASNTTERLAIATIVMLSAWSPTIFILLGKQGPFVGLICIGGAWCIINSQKVAARRNSRSGTFRGSFIDPVSITQWTLLAICLFFYTGHWCTFDGLRYGAAFIGFEHFNIIRQGILLAIDTFGVSHILPILSLPFIFSLQYNYEKTQAKDALFFNLTQAYLHYGLITAVTTTFTVICVTIQRRHLMVWGLFAPKYVFDVLGLLLTDVLICFASLLYY